MTEKKPLIYKVTVLACLVAMVVVMLGSWTRLKDSGLGCPDWPGCYGHLDVRKAIEHVERVNSEAPDTLREAHKTVPEMVHRYFASTLGFLILVIAGLAVAGRNKHDHPVALPLFLVGLVIFQGILGMLTVTMGLYPPTVTGHLLGGFATLTLLFMLALRFGNLVPDVHDPAIYVFKPLVIIGLVILILQIMLGGWTAANYAAAVCTQLPICEGPWTEKLNIAEAFRMHHYKHIHDFEFGVLDHDARTTIHVFHRIGAIVTTIILAALSVVFIIRASSRFYMKAGMALAILLALQVGLGVSNVVFDIPLYVAVAHNFGGVLLLICLSTILYSIRKHESHS